jgi:transcriptional regulator with XRE-family HTH domain
MTELLSRRVKQLRLERGWTHEEIARRAGLALATYRRFERTGSISLERLLKLALVLGALPAFGSLFVLPDPRSLAELQRRVEQPLRRRGRRRTATT